MVAKDVRFSKVNLPANNWPRVWAPMMLGLGVFVTFLWMALLSYGIVGLIWWAL